MSSDKGILTILILPRSIKNTLKYDETKKNMTDLLFFTASIVFKYTLYF